MPEISTQYPIFIVDDEERLLESLFITLRTAGFKDISTFSNGNEILGMLPQLQCRVLLLDLFMPGAAGEDILDQINLQCPHIQVIVITGINETDTAVRCIKKGAFDYLVKPVEPQRLITSVRRAMSHSDLIMQNQQLKQRLLSGQPDHPEYFEDIITNDPKIKSMFSYLEIVAPESDPVLITGETGTGKDLIASVMHKASGRKGSFISVNTAGLDDNMFSDTLFGHVRGAFTDAKEPRKGLIEEAANGTLFLDEIGDLSQASQVKLLKLTQDHVYLPLGSDKPLESSARIIAATNRDLEARQMQGLFRRDLFYRINTYHIHLPPLRERREDIILLTHHFLEQACSQLNLDYEPLTRRLTVLLKSYDYPGNIRELRSMIFSAMARGGMNVMQAMLEELLGIDPSSNVDEGRDIRHETWVYPDPLPTLKQASRVLIDQALKKCRGNQAKAAGILGISRQALNKRLKNL